MRGQPAAYDSVQQSNKELSFLTVGLGVDESSSMTE